FSGKFEEENQSLLMSLRKQTCYSNQFLLLITSATWLAPRTKRRWTSSLRNTSLIKWL
ncbi:hypothetical protein HAX54_027396, partial [Datura stramonium]|nr:hypothetical protein [Datura stramonium]